MSPHLTLKHRSNVFGSGKRLRIWGMRDGAHRVNVIVFFGNGVCVWQEQILVPSQQVLSKYPSKDELEKMPRCTLLPWKQGAFYTSVIFWGCSHSSAPQHTHISCSLIFSQLLAAVDISTRDPEDTIIHIHLPHWVRNIGPFMPWLC